MKVRIFCRGWDDRLEAVFGKHENAAASVDNRESDPDRPRWFKVPAVYLHNTPGGLTVDLPLEAVSARELLATFKPLGRFEWDLECEHPWLDFHNDYD